MTLTLPPTVDLKFLLTLVESSDKVNTFKIDDTTFHILKGSKKLPIAARMILIKDQSGEVDYEYAIGIAIKIKKLSELMAWLEEHKKFKDGAYFIKP